MPTVDIIDEIFIVAAPGAARSRLCDPALWGGWFPELRLTPYDDRGLLGVRWRVSGALTGTAEVWLEEFGDGVIVHVYVRAEPTPPAHNRSVVRRYVLPLKRLLTEAKDELEAGREPGIPRVPLSERVVSPPKQTTARRQRRSTRAPSARDRRGRREGATGDGKRDDVEHRDRR